MENIKISVVMPIYRAEKHLENSVNSILNQTYKPYEIILVNDNSPDGSGAICDRFADEYDYVSVIHHDVNKGVSETRNDGMDIASGDYIFFMDCDDVIDSDLLEQVVLSLEKNRAQVVVFGMIEDYYDKNDVLRNSVRIPYGKELYLTNAHDLRDEVINLECKTFYGYPWNKIYDLKYLRDSGVRFEKITLIEDIKFNVELFQHIQSLNILGTTPYHYKKRIDDSLTNKFVPDYYELHRERVAMINAQHKLWRICSEDVQNKLANIYVRYIFSAIQRNCDSRANMSLSKRVGWIKKLWTDSLVLELIPYAKSDSKLLSVMIRLLQGKNTYLCLLLGRIIYIVKNKLPIVFSKFKQVR